MKHNTLISAIAIAIGMACLATIAPVTGDAIIATFDNVFVICERFVDDAADLTNCTMTTALDTDVADSWIGFGVSDALKGTNAAMVGGRRSFIQFHLISFLFCTNDVNFLL